MRRLRKRLRSLERDFHDSFTGEIATASDRRRSERYVAWIDHGVLRAFWHNFHEVAPGVFRSNHPDRKRLERYAARGIRTILTLRGAKTKPHHRLEQEACAELGLTLITVPMSSRRAPRRRALLGLLRVFDRIERPFLMHCKSGADRTSLASAIYLIHVQGASVAEARRQLGIRYLHLRWTATGILDHVLDLYEARLTQGPIAIADWIATEYDRDRVEASFRGGLRRRVTRRAASAPRSGSSR